MEAYMNFGVIGGIFFFILLGKFCRTLYERFLVKPDFLRTVMVLAFTSSFMLWTRNTFITGIRSLAWTFLLAWILQLLCRSEDTEDIQYETI
jgi:oligosaccharide repeat unit polymerase